MSTALARPFLRRGAVALGALVGGITLSAGYQLLYDEGKDLIQRIRIGMARRRRRNEMIILALVGTDFPPDHLDTITRSRNCFATGLQILATAELLTPHRDQLRGVLQQVVNA
jgi:hypothetical protein